MFNKKDNMSMIERLFWLSKLNQSGGSGGGGGGDTPSGGVFIVPAELDMEQHTMTLTKTWNEVKAAYDANKVIEIRYSVEEAGVYYSLPFVGLLVEGSEYGIGAIIGAGESSVGIVYFITDDPDGYPVSSQDGGGGGGGDS